MSFFVLIVGVVFIILAIAVFKVHPFLALLVAAFLVGSLSPVPLRYNERLQAARSELGRRLQRGEIDQTEFQAEMELLPAKVQSELRAAQGPGDQAVEALELTTQELGSTAASIAVVIALAAIIGQCLMESGAADRITRRFLRLLGEPRAAVAMFGSGYLLSVPVFFDTVFFLLVPLARALRMRTGKNYVLYIMAIAGGAVITHSLVPPTPGPLLMVDNLSGLGLDLGTTIVFGFLLGLPPAAVALCYSVRTDRRLKIPFREAPGSSHQQLEAIVARGDDELPGFWVSILPVLLPVLLITGDTALATLQRQGFLSIPPLVLGWSAFLGNKNFALFAAAAGAAWVLLRREKLSLGQLRDRLEPAIMSAGVIILITSAGGAFGKMLARTGISESLREVSTGAGLGTAALLLLAWGLAVTMKIAQGSGTVSIITASGMMAALLSGQGTLPFHPIYLFAAIGFGSMAVSWMNDSGFWVVCKMSGFTERETLSTWTQLLTVIAVAGLVEVLILSFVLPLA